MAAATQIFTILQLFRNAVSCCKASHAQLETARRAFSDATLSGHGETGTQILAVDVTRKPPAKKRKQGSDPLEVREVDFTPSPSNAAEPAFDFDPSRKGQGPIKQTSNV